MSSVQVTRDQKKKKIYGTTTEVKEMPPYRYYNLHHLIILENKFN